MAFPPGFLDELRSRVSLPDLVGRRVRLIRRGREHSGLCPFHNEKTPSFYVVDDKGFFHCFGCGAHGDAIGYVMRAENLDFIEAVERLAGEAGIAVPQQTPQERERAQRQKTLLEALAAAADFFEAQLWSATGARARDYLTRRGLDEETTRRFRLGWAPDDRQALRRALSGDFPEALLHEAGLLRMPEDGGTPYDYFRGRVIFPIGDRAGRAIAFGGRALGDNQPKYLNSPDTPLFDKGRTLYGSSLARTNLSGTAYGEGPPIILVEGYMDVIALHRAGFGGAVAPLGTGLTEAQLEELWRLGPEPVICLDNDRPGAMAAHRALNRALPILKPGRSLRFLALPAGEDPDSLIRSSGPDEFAARLARARPLSEFWWDEELRLSPNDTPERRADLERRIIIWVDKIADRMVQAEYRRFFRERLFALGRAARPTPAGRRVPLRVWPAPITPAGHSSMPFPTAAHATPRPPDCNAALVLADGTVFWGHGIGATGQAVGEVCFNTAITGYQEILTDPSYAGQIITFTFPHIGNVGANREDIETVTPPARGVIVRELPTAPSNYRAEQSLDAWLKSHGIVGLCGVDTRRLTRHIRDRGAPNGVIAYQADGRIDVDGMQAEAAAWPGLEGMDLAKEVTCRQTYGWNETAWRREAGYGRQEAPKFHVVAVDYGMKRNILRLLAEHGCRVTVVPATASTEDILRHEPDGVFLSNGPGDPAATGEYAVPVLRDLVASGKPVFGICLGHQMLALALGGRTYKLDKGHRGANQPVADKLTGKVEITSQNHGFVVDPESLPRGVEATHTSLFDRTNEGLQLVGRPVFSVQHHPEASPGPQDSHYLFRRFIDAMGESKGGGHK